MKENRRDAWNPSDDLILTEITLDHIRKGSTQLAAFEAASERLGCTAAACGFRWNDNVRKTCEESIKQAKLLRKQNYTKTKVSVDVVHVEQHKINTTELLPILQIIELINQLQNAIIKRDNQIVVLEQEIETLRKSELTMSDDYRTLLDILSRARELGTA
ncbi:RsfA family transcriptional regulator [Paenibacillus sp. GCM10027627]|uniref:RsfA family transcriptional regulator n=1 Tax=unclassified Paenibacillus TaxID=185978 RepID=UPI003625B46E